MIKNTIAVNWNIEEETEKGAFVELYYKCPHCNCSHFESVYVDVSSEKDYFLNPFRVHHICSTCNKLIVIRCEQDN